MTRGTTPRVAAGWSLLAAIAIAGCQGPTDDSDQSDSLRGSDSNQDGVRDDIEAMIERQYPDPVKQRAARQLAAAIQASIELDHDDVDAAKANAVRSMRATACVYARFDGPDDRPAAVTEQLAATTANTKERLASYLAYSRSLDGTTGRYPEGDTCE